VTIGLWSAGLHIPGAANLANRASIIARSSGEAMSFPALMPSARWAPHQLNPRWRARSSSENLPSGLIVMASFSATFSSWSGRSSVAFPARNASAFSTSADGMWSGRSRMNF